MSEMFEQFMYVFPVALIPNSTCAPPFPSLPDKDGPNMFYGVIKSTVPSSIGLDGAYGLGSFLTPRGKFPSCAETSGICVDLQARDDQVRARLGLVATVPGQFIESYGHVGPYYSVTKPLDSAGGPLS